MAAAPAPAHHAVTMQRPATANARPHTADQMLGAHGQDRGGDHGCQMIMACNYASVRHARASAMIRFPAVFVQAAFLADPIPAAAALRVEPPPPRLAV